MSSDRDPSPLPLPLFCSISFIKTIFPFINLGSLLVAGELEFLFYFLWMLFRNDTAQSNFALSDMANKICVRSISLMTHQLLTQNDFKKEEKTKAWHSANLWLNPLLLPVHLKDTLWVDFTAMVMESPLLQLAFNIIVYVSRSTYSAKTEKVGMNCTRHTMTHKKHFNGIIIITSINHTYTSTQNRPILCPNLQFTELSLIIITDLPKKFDAWKWQRSIHRIEEKSRRKKKFNLFVTCTCVSIIHTINFCGYDCVLNT